MNDIDNAWIRRFSATETDGVRLVCFPHAGGSASFFFPFAAELGSSCDVLGVQYPGRQDRRSEKPIDDVAVLADRVHAALPDLGERPLAFFGHSMGAVIAYEVARRLRRDGRPLAGLIVSGRRAPSLQRYEDFHRRDDDTLLAEVRGLSGTNASLLDDEELRQMILPALRADYRAIETYRHAPGPALTCPLSVITGDRDPRVSVDEAKTWCDHTTGAFSLRTFPGGHFYLNDARAEVAEAIGADLASFTKALMGEVTEAG